MYKSRIIENKVVDILNTPKKALQIEGVKACGKTTLSKLYIKNILNLTKTEDLDLLRSQPDKLLVQNGGLIIDEWQVYPEIFDRVKIIEDEIDSKIILTGSSLPQASTKHSGGGRIRNIKLRPFTFEEYHPDQGLFSLEEILKGTWDDIGKTTLTINDYIIETLRTGLPTVSSPNDITDYLELLCSRDVADAGYRINVKDSVFRLLQVYAACESETVSQNKMWETFSKNGKESIDKDTFTRYVNILNAMFILEDIPSWSPSKNKLSSLKNQTKRHLVDPGF